MVDPDNNMDNAAPISESDDTKTRKTVRLKSAAPVGLNLTPQQPKAPLSDPLSGRDTDTGNLEVMEDTQTRRTVKLRPISPGAAPGATLPRPGVAAAPTGDGANTQTRKTIVLKPTAVAPAVKLDAATGAVPESDDTKTRKTVRLRPSAVMPPPIAGSPVAPAAPAAAAADAGTELDSSDTIKIARPPRPGSMIPPKPVMLPGQAPTAAPAAAPSHSLPVAKPLPPQTPLPKPGEGPTGSTAVPHIPSPVPHIPAPAAPPAKPAVEEELQLKPAGSRNAEKEGDPTVLKGPDAEAATGSASADAPTFDGKSPLAGMKPLNAAKTGASKLYLGLAVASLLLVGGTLTLTLVQYLNLCQQQNIVLPLLSQSK